MEKLDIAIDVIKISIAIVSIIIAYITTKYGSRNKKLKKLAENFNIVRNYTEKFVRLAEDFTDFAGSSKKEWALNKVHGVCLEKGIPFDPVEADKILEQVVDLTKVINKRDPKPDLSIPPHQRIG